MQKNTPAINIPVTVAFGDGIGPEIMNATLYILKEAKVPIKVETIEIGEQLYKKNYSSGIAEDTWEALARTKVLLKAPITTPLGGGYKSLNVTLRKALGLYSNVRPSISYHPFLDTKFPELDLVIVRENEEDIYAGIEYRQTHNMYESIKLISRVGSEKIVRYAFDYAVKNNRKTVSCFSKDNIMKFSDGIFHKVFLEIAKEYPQIKSNYYIIDIGTAKLASSPGLFDVIVTSNLYGDIISDVASEISGSVGLAGSANIGQEYAMFEAVHGSAPDIAGKDIANPSGLINGAIMMLVHLGLGSYASLIENAWKKTLEDGVHTGDIYNESISSKKVGTQEFAREVVKRLGQKPSKLKAVNYPDQGKSTIIARDYKIDTTEKKELVGVDVFIQSNVGSAHEVAKIVSAITSSLELKTIAAKGLKLWPRKEPVEFLSDHWCLRYMSKNDGPITHAEISSLLKSFAEAKIDFIKTENLYNFDNNRAYSLAQGE
ncbi:MAG: NADP-dependent isocitrate dehydrogenase [Alphaproteobacteria bacterium]|nr:NADP-dependent isocitrate dehydrogenase [Alphaproteobacteria bacterium]